MIILEPEAVVTAPELKKELDAGKTPILLDVREPHEYDICRLEGSKLIPLGDVERRVGELDRDQDIVAYCRSGARSAQAVKFLREAGFTSTRNLVGGVLAWADKVDSSMPKY
jgi:adenylyltransferase/sulfurtransferase